MRISSFSPHEVDFRFGNFFGSISAVVDFSEPPFMWLVLSGCSLQACRVWSGVLRIESHLKAIYKFVLCLLCRIECRSGGECGDKSCS